MSELQDVLERFADAGEARGADAVFDAARHTIEHRQKRRRVRGAVAVLVALTLVGGAAVAIARTSDRERVHVVTPPAPAAPAPVTAAQLIAGHWASLPPAPIVARTSSSVVWTGTEMLVWGGASGDEQNVFHADGAAYDPTSHTWRQLPPAPLRARFYPATTWSGTEMVIWGGYINPHGTPTNDGAAYNPTTNQWRKIATGPLTAQANAMAVWTGGRVVIFGDMNNEAAAYDPRTDHWEALTLPPAPGVTLIYWRHAVRIDGDRLLVWRTTETTTQNGSFSTTTRTATVRFVYDDATGDWNAVPSAPNAIAAPEESFWTGSEVIVRGTQRECLTCEGPPAPEISATYDPKANTWTPLPADALAPADGIGGDHFVSAWTGAALWSFNSGTQASGPDFQLEPGDASVYNASARAWTRLRGAVPQCWPGTVHPIWTGHEVLIYCAVAGASGLAYVPGE